MDTTAAHEVSAAIVSRNDVVKSPDYTVAFMVDQSPDDAFSAINNVRGWWSENIEGPTDEPNGEFVFHNEPWHVSRIRVVGLVPGKRVVWRVLENYMNFVNDTREWIGNEMVFDIARKGDKTEVRFTDPRAAADAVYSIASRELASALSLPPGPRNRFAARPAAPRLRYAWLWELREQD